MTVNSIDITDGPYVGNNIVQFFDYSFVIQYKNELQVYETNLSGVQTLLTVDVDYSVGNIGTNEGSVQRLAGPLPTGWQWYIRSNYQATQLTSFNSQGAFFPELHEFAMDKLTYLIQQSNDKISRTLHYPDSYAAGANGALLPVPQSQKLLRWRDDLTGLENIDISVINPGSVVISDYTRKVSSFAALATVNLLPGETVLLTQHTSGGKGGGVFQDTAGTITNDGGTQINSIVNPGRHLKRLHVTWLLPEYFGAVGGGAVDDSAAFNLLSSYGVAGGSLPVLLSGVKYRLNASWNVTNRNVMIHGTGSRTSILQFYGCHGVVHSGDFVLGISDCGIETDSLGLYDGFTYGVATPPYGQDSLRLNNVNMWGITYGTTYWRNAGVIQDSSNVWIVRLTVIGQYAVSPFFAGNAIKVTSTVAKPSTGVHFWGCTFNYVNTGALIQSNVFPSIEGVRFNYCGFVSVKTGVSWISSVGGYTPPLLTFCESHIDLASNAVNPICIYLNSISQLEIKSCDFYSYAANGVCLWLNNVQTGNVSGNTFVGGSFANMSAMLLESGTTFVNISENNFAGPFTNGIYVLPTALDQNKSLDNRFSGLVNNHNDGTGKLYINGESKTRVKLTAAQSIPDSTPTMVSWAAADENFFAAWVIGSPTRITVPAGIRSLSIAVTIRFATNATGYRRIIIKRNGAFGLSLPIQSTNAITGQPTDMTVHTGLLSVVAGDYFEIEVTQTCGAPLNIDQAVSYCSVNYVKSN